MRRELQGRYVTISTVGEKTHPFVPAPLPLEQLGIVKELTTQKRNRLFSYVGYIEIISRGTGTAEQVGQCNYGFWNRIRFASDGPSFW